MELTIKCLLVGHMTQKAIRQKGKNSFFKSICTANSLWRSFGSSSMKIEFYYQLNNGASSAFHWGKKKRHLKNEEDRSWRWLHLCTLFSARRSGVRVRPLKAIKFDAQSTGRTVYLRRKVVISTRHLRS